MASSLSGCVVNKKPVDGLAAAGAHVFTKGKGAVMLSGCMTTTARPSGHLPEGVSVLATRDCDEEAVISLMYLVHTITAPASSISTVLVSDTAAVASKGTNTS